MFDYELMPKCKRTAALGGIALPMNNCLSFGARDRGDLSIFVDISDRSSEEKVVSSLQDGEC